jgi:hypothetical protein|tara:strand:+ start:1015 stop:1149 length:135 start_codon:yes stop_codon:yes gene_type:complete
VHSAFLSALSAPDLKLDFLSHEVDDFRDAQGEEALHGDIWRVRE